MVCKSKGRTASQQRSNATSLTGDVAARLRRVARCRAGGNLFLIQRTKHSDHRKQKWSERFGDLGNSRFDTLSLLILAIAIAMIRFIVDPILVNQGESTEHHSEFKSFSGDAIILAGLQFRFEVALQVDVVRIDR
jgi:hypothetical protein